jgi:nitrite reductase (NO-forming)
MDINVELEAVELPGVVTEGISYDYWTFDSKVPGPFLRVRAGDTVHLILANRAGNIMVHSIDLHAVTGPGGGAVATQILPGSERGVHV